MPKVAAIFCLFLFLDKSRDLSTLVLVLLSALVKRWFVSCMRDFSKCTWQYLMEGYNCFTIQNEGFYSMSTQICSKIIESLQDILLLLVGDMVIILHCFFCHVPRQVSFLYQT